MIRTDKICFKRSPCCFITLEKLQQDVETKLSFIASATKLRSIRKEMQLEVNLTNPISLQTVNQIFKMIMDEGSKIQEFSWRTEKIGMDRIGILEVTIS